MTFSKVVALDGPSGSGKSTIAKEVAKRMGIVYVDTGAMYRAIGLSCHDSNIPFEEGSELENFLSNLDLQYGVSESCLIMANGADLTTRIREHHVSDLASKISKIPLVRTFLLDFQRSLGHAKVCVMEGRDIGTVVFPDSFCKIFMTASFEVRAQRRLDQLKEQGEDNHSFEEVLEDLKIRDERDMNRDVAPLKQAEDGILLDTSDLNFEQVLDRICEIAASQAGKNGIQL